MKLYTDDKQANFEPSWPFLTEWQYIRFGHFPNNGFLLYSIKFEHPKVYFTYHYYVHMQNYNMCAIG